MDLEEDISQNHVVRVVNAVINQFNDSIFAYAYPDEDETVTTLSCLLKSSSAPLLNGSTPRALLLKLYEKKEDQEQAGQDLAELGETSSLTCDKLEKGPIC